jgi:hypothetical protein
MHAGELVAACNPTWAAPFETCLLYLARLVLPFLRGNLGRACAALVIKAMRCIIVRS